MADYGIHGGEEFKRLCGEFMPSSFTKLRKFIFFLRLIFPVAGSEILSRNSGQYSFKQLSILLNHLEYARLEASLISAIIFLDRFSAILALFVDRQSTISFSVYWRCSRRSILFGENSITVSTAAHSGAQLRSLLRLIN
ncbi:hypothetical protein YC2023_016548 [Brassica napus]